MKAITYRKYGPPGVLQLREIPPPIPKDNEIRIQVRATAVNSGDWRLRKADPFIVRLFFGLLKPKNPILGSVFSGIVEATGTAVTKFQTGDIVFGLSEVKLGTYAEYLTLPEDAAIALKPGRLSHTEAASLLFGGHTALHFLNQASLDKETHILIYGASGAVGTSAIQLAKHLGAHVTAVCSSRNTALVKGLGADEVIDYTTTDIYTIPQRYEVIYETVNKTSVPRLAKLLKPKGTLILGSALVKGMLQGAFLSGFKGIKVISGVAKATAKDIEFLAQLAEEKELFPVIDRTYALKEIVEAHRYVEQGHKSGNVVVQLTNE